MPNADGTRTPNYRDVFSAANAAAIPDCADGGVLSTLAGIIGCMQANEVIKIITGLGDILSGKMMLWDALTMQQRMITIGKVTKKNITSLSETISNNTISADELRAGMSSGRYHLIDVRTPEEHTEFNIGGVNIPLSELMYHISKVDSDKPIVFYCLTGNRSRKATEWMKEDFPGLTILFLEGGIQFWQE
jgi:sulfur-carrier protein adenylyltransferase/sulfurtransferase